MSAVKIQRDEGKILIELDEAEFVATGLQSMPDELTIVDRERFLEFAAEHFFTLTHDEDADGGRSSWWRRHVQALAKAAASQNAGVSQSARPAPTCGCDPEIYDGG